MLEGVSLMVAVRAVRAGAEAASLSFLEFVRRGMDPTSIAVMMEDAGAVAGLCIAGAVSQPPAVVMQALISVRTPPCCNGEATLSQPESGMDS